ncbi:hypothetical protein [Streptomyces sp. NPDC006477]|uniref:hypothetical protein n=1 Tax=Streptomyces sp. NPDC006477 TaxID=3364747 RepID=UPI00369AECC2
MAEQNPVDINVDQARVVENLKVRFASKLADLEHENAMMSVALEQVIHERDEAVADNQRLREEANQPRPD